MSVRVTVQHRGLRCFIRLGVGTTYVRGFLWIFSGYTALTREPTWVTPLGTRETPLLMTRRRAASRFTPLRRLYGARLRTPTQHFLASLSLEGCSPEWG